MNNLAEGREFCLCCRFKVCIGARYLVGFIGDGESKCDWLKYHTLTWEKKIIAITKMLGKYSHDSYTAVFRTIQSK